jgi:hypothetical protein
LPHKRINLRTMQLLDVREQQAFDTNCGNTGDCRPDEERFHYMGPD